MASTAAATSLPLDARRKKQQPEGQKKRKKKKETQTTRNSLTGLPQQDNPSMREEIRFSPPLTPASPLAPLLSACLPAYLPTCLSDSRCDFLKHFCMLLRGCVQRSRFRQRKTGTQRGRRRPTLWYTLCLPGHFWNTYICNKIRIPKYIHTYIYKL